MIIWPLLISVMIASHGLDVRTSGAGSICRIYSCSRTIHNFQYQLSKLGPINQSLSNSEWSNVHLAITERKIQDLYVYELIKPKDLLDFSLKIFSLFQLNWQPLPPIRGITLISQWVLKSTQTAHKPEDGCQPICIYGQVLN